MPLNIKKVLDTGMFNEGPHWDGQSQALFFTGLANGYIQKYVPATGEHTKTKVGDHVSFIIPVEGAKNQFIVAIEVTVCIIEWDGVEGSTVKVVRDFGPIENVEPEEYRCNDGKADPRGRLFTGTLSIKELTEILNKNFDVLRKGKLYCIEKEDKKVCDTRIGVTNGMAWDGDIFYYIDSLERNIRCYNYDVNTGNISNMKHIFDLEENELVGYPDGATIDTNGHLWVALYDGASIIQIDPKRGKLLRKLDMPDLKVSSVTFGGPLLDTLYVTSGIENGIFAITGLGVRGFSSTKFKLN